MRDTRDLKRRIDDLAWAIQHLKARLAITQHGCPRCFAPPGATCTIDNRFAQVHQARLDILERLD